MAVELQNTRADVLAPASLLPPAPLPYACSLAVPSVSGCDVSGRSARRPRSYLDWLPSEVVWHVASLVDDAPEVAAAAQARPALTDAPGYSGMRKALPRYGRVRDLFLALCGWDAELAHRVREVFYDTAAPPRLSAAQSDAAAWRGYVDGARAALEFLEETACGAAYCMKCGGRGRRSCYFTKVRSCRACRDAVARRALTFEEVHSLVDHVGVSRAFHEAKVDGVLLFSLREDCDVGWLEGRAVSVSNHPGVRGKSAVDSDVGVEAGFALKGKNRLVEGGDSHASGVEEPVPRADGSRISTMDSPVENAPGACVGCSAIGAMDAADATDAAGATGAGGLTAAAGTAGATGAMSMAASVRCAWYNGGGTCVSCVGTCCDGVTPWELKKYGVCNVFAPRSGDTMTVLPDFLSSKAFVFSGKVRKLCAKEVIEFASMSYGVPHHLVVEHVRNLREGFGLKSRTKAHGDFMVAY